MTTQATDVLVIGAGPAGCATAALLAQAGRDVVLLERESFPRYRVGESLIPYCWYPLERLGLVDEVADSAFVVEKHSVQFVNLEGKRAKPYYFFEHYDHPSHRTWQVVRRDFDDMLLRNALKQGVQLKENTTATRLLQDGERVCGAVTRDAAGEQAEWQARVVVDASGRDTFAQGALRWKVPDEKLRKLAIWTYYEGAQRDEGLDQGATTIAYLPNKGWFWYLPLANDRVSVGVVAEPDYLFRDTRELEEIFEREVRVQPWIEGHLAPGRRTQDFQVTRDFTYRSKHCAKDGLVLVGDAFSFLDPVFSSGVFLALHMGVNAADAIDAALSADDVSAKSFTIYGDRMRQAIEAMRRLVHAFYDPDFSFGTFLKAHPDMRAPLTDCLIGNLHADFEPLFEAMSAFADVPDPLPHGGADTHS